MKKNFPSFFQPTDEEFSHLWDDCIFVFDTNALLNVYRYTEKTRQEFLRILKAVSARIWIPHQVGLEFVENRETVITEQLQVYKDVSKIAQELRSKFLSQLKDKLPENDRHPFLDKEKLEAIKQPIDEAIAAIDQILEETRAQHPALLEDDHLLTALDELFDSSIGSPYDQEKLMAIYGEGKSRFELLIPPGYMDVKDKPGFRQYGDLVLWFQIIDHAKNVKKPVILVTNDRKEDWWRVVGRQTKGARYELVAEMRAKAGVAFRMYRSAQFMEYAQKYLDRAVEKDAIDEVREVEKQQIITSYNVQFDPAKLDISWASNGAGSNFWLEQINKWFAEYHKLKNEGDKGDDSNAAAPDISA